MHLIFKEGLIQEDIDFRLEVVGCNPRALSLDPCGYTLDSSAVYRVLEETCEEVLGISISKANERLELVASVVKINNKHFTSCNIHFYTFF